MTQRAVFLDRDGTLIEHYEVLTDPNQLQLIPAVPAALKLLRDRGFLLVMVTNQSAVARGLLKEKKLLEIHDTLRSLLASNGVYLDAIYYCPCHPDARIEKYRKDSPLRKPKPGMLHQAAGDLDIDLAQSWVVGDDDRDVEMGRAAGCRTVFIESYGAVGVRTGNSNPHFRAVNLQEAANLIVRYADASDEPTADADAMDPDENHTPQNTTATTEPELAQLHDVPINLPTPGQSQPASWQGASTESEEAIPSRSADDGSSPASQTKALDPPPKPASEQSQAVSLRATNTVSHTATPSVLTDGPPTPNPTSNIQNPQSHTPARPVRIPPHPDHTETAPSDRRLPLPDAADRPKEDTHDLLAQILREIKAQNRFQSFREFSVAKLLAGITQMVVVFFVVLAFWFHNAQNASPAAVHTALLAAAVFQLVTLSLLVLHKH